MGCRTCELRHTPSDPEVAWIDCISTVSNLTLALAQSSHCDLHDAGVEPIFLFACLSSV